MNTEELDGGVLKVALTPADLKEPLEVNAFFEKLLRDDERKRILVDIAAVKDATSLMMGTLLWVKADPK